MIGSMPEDQKPFEVRHWDIVEHAVTCDCLACTIKSMSQRGTIATLMRLEWGKPYPHRKVPKAKP